MLFTNSWVHSSFQSGILLFSSCSLFHSRSVSYPDSSVSSHCKTFSKASCLWHPHRLATQETVYLRGDNTWLLPLGCCSQELPVVLSLHFVYASHRQWASMIICQTSSPLQMCRNCLKQDLLKLYNGQCEHANTVFLGSRLWKDEAAAFPYFLKSIRETWRHVFTSQGWLWV